MEGPDPGWYPDPEGGDGVRWWDGGRWTDHVSTPEGGAVAPPARQQPAPTTPWSPETAAPSDNVWDDVPGRPSPAGGAQNVGWGANPPAGPTMATFGQRLGALLVDSLLIFFIGLPLVGLLVGILVGASAEVEATGTTEAPIEGMLSAISWTFLALPLLYRVLLEGGAYGQTVGKWAVNISVRLPDGSAPVGRGRAAGRAMMTLVSGWPLGLGYLWMIWDRENRTWHDMVADVRVIKVTHKVPFSALLRSAFSRNSN